MKQIITLFALIMLLPMESAASESTAYEAYGLLIGSNRAGTDQAPLAYAHRDARRMAATLNEVAGFKKENLEILLDPDKGSVESAIDTFESILQEKARVDEKTVFLFYYSGHARTTGLNLGADDFSLSELKDRLRKLPATVTVVLLDACQTGAISNVKGVSAAAQRGFSYNSVDQLNVSGMAVIASSAGSELSQESKKLRGSYFSHHFTVGLRGPADADENGVVTLAEAYQYAYHRTLSSTALTTVGRQHATLEMDLKGKGDMPFSWPGNFESSLLIPASLDGEVMLTHKSSGTVSAEIKKVKGKSYRVALTPGRYEGFVKLSNRQAYQCDIVVPQRSAHELNLNACRGLTLADDTAKGNGEQVYRIAKTERQYRREYLMAEFHLGYFGAGDSPYTRKLADFEFKGLERSDVLGAAVSMVGSPFSFLSVGVVLATMDRRTGDSNLTPDEKRVSWRSFRIGGFVRGNLVLKRGLLVPYAQVGAGVGKATLKFEMERAGGSIEDEMEFKGIYFSGGAGLQMNPIRWFGITLLHLEYTRAQLVEMTEAPLDEKHNNGGLSIFTGIRFGY
ncbi:MAG: caspase family protein [Deltaproteobacteria bacterium]|nr:caspase family protein [Deltaproteobacteria bacterium]